MMRKKEASKIETSGARSKRMREVDDFISNKGFVRAIAAKNPRVNSGWISTLPYLQKERRDIAFPPEMAQR